MDKKRNNNGVIKALPFRILRKGYTVVELMAVIVIVSVLAATVGVFFVKLLKIQETDREEAYIREKLSDICGAYADFLSIGSGFSWGTNFNGQATGMVRYRLESGGVSLETGLVTRVAYLESLLNATNHVFDLNVYSMTTNGLGLQVNRRSSGDASLIPLMGNIISCTIIPLNAGVESADEETSTRFGEPYQTSDTALGLFRAMARYNVENEDGQLESKTVTVERVVRLWNRE